MSIQPLTLSDNNSPDINRLYNLLLSVTQISKSIASNLDLDNLLNSTLTLIHQNFGFEKINIFLLHDEGDKVISKYSLSKKGFENTYSYHEENNGPVYWVLNNREQVFIDNVSSQTKFSPDSIDPEIKSELVLPMVNGGSILGVLDLCSEVEKRVNPNETEIFQSLADYLALAIRNAKLFHNEQVRRQIGEKVYDIVADISPDSSLDEINISILSLLEKFIPYDASGLWLFDYQLSGSEINQFTSALKLAAVNISDQFDVKNDQQNKLLSLQIKNQIQGEEEESPIQFTYIWITDVINSVLPVIGDGEGDIEPLGKLLSLPNGYSLLGIPLLFKNETIGIIVLVQNKPDQYTRESQIVGSIFAAITAVVINNAKLFSVAHDQTWMSTVVQQATQTFQSIDSMEDLLVSIANMIIDIAGANACTIYLWDQSMNAFYPQISYGYDTEQQNRLDEWDVPYGSVSAFDQLVQLKSPMILSNETITDDLAALIFPYYNLNDNLLILFPMIVQDNILGAILIDFSGSQLEKESTQKVWDDLYTITQGILQQAAISIENLQMIKTREEEAYISVALLQVAQAIVSLNKLDDILSSIVRITPILVGVKRCIIYLWDRENLVFKTAQNYGFSKSDLQFEGQLIRSNEFPFLETIFNNNRIAYYQLAVDSTPSTWSDIKREEFNSIDSMVINPSDQSTIPWGSSTLQENARLLIGFPLTVIGEVLGVMLVEEEEPIKGSPSYHIREKRIEIVNGITQQAAIAIKNEYLRKDVLNNERMEKELQLAREIQQTFIPDHLPYIEGWDMDARWQPARQVAGDFFDFFHLNENRMGFVIADVADKGMPAALFMTLIRTLIRAAAKDDISPASVLKQVNEMLLHDTKNGMFVTVFYAVIDFTSGIIRYANAGHNPPIMKTIQSSELYELTRTSMALGIFPDIEVEESQVVLHPGDLLFCYTDGITEAFSINQEMFGISRLNQILLNTQFASVKDLLDEIDKSVREFISGSEIYDDMTLASIYRKV